MPFPELTINSGRSSFPSIPGRADIAMFVGLVPRRNKRLPEKIRSSLVKSGWAGPGPFARRDEAVEALLDVPVSVASWGEFDALFAWDNRLVTSGGAATLPCALGLAVKRYFAEGGVKAWIVRTGDPLPLLGPYSLEQLTDARAALLGGDDQFVPKNLSNVARIVPGLNPASGIATPGDPASWTGCAHIWGVDDAAMLLVPDLPELLAGPPTTIESPPQQSLITEQFKACAGRLADGVNTATSPFVSVGAPRLDQQGLSRWASVIRSILTLLATPVGAAHRRDVMLLASLPLTNTDATDVIARDEQWPMAWLDALVTPTPPPKGAAPPQYRLTDADHLGSARLQLAYPWIATEASVAMPGGIEGPEGALAGALARSALGAGGFRSAAGQGLPTVRKTVPELGTASLRRALPDGRADWLGDRISLIGRKPNGMVLLSDSTMASSRQWRSGGVSRLIGIILRAARWLGQERLFEPSGPALWAGIKSDFDGFMEELRRLGALAGASPQDAYDVRCDATTMSQNDIDAGRVIVTVAFTAAQPIERVSVTLSLKDDGNLPMQVAA